jgi:ubiquinone/menaquinone biosynthesis C-methylase UbiE
MADALGISTAGYTSGIDIGGGLGMHAPWLLEMCKRVYVTDIEPYSALYDGALFRLVIEKFQRNSVPYAHERVEFHKADAQDLIYKDGCFDLVCSINAMEHIPDPKRAFAEIVRVTMPNALVMLQFDPLWHSPFGHHLWHLGFEPWAHLLEPDAAFINRIRASGGTDADVKIFMQETNRRSFDFFRSLLEEQYQSYFSFMHFDRWAKNEDDEENAMHPNYSRCLSAGIPKSELLTRGIRFIGVRV